MFRKYYELGFSVIPVNGKKAFTDGWSAWSEKRQPEALIDDYEKRFYGPQYGIGIVCGRVSGVIALDIDTDDKRVLDACPRSPVVKRGKKGETRFFKWRAGIPTLHPKGIDILATGAQTVVPPSLHPETKAPYVWLTPDTLENYAVTDLPELTDSDIALINGASKDIKHVATGRNVRLTEIIRAIFHTDNDKADEWIAEQIYNADLKEHPNNPYFADRKEAECAKANGNASVAALLFAKRHRKQLERKGDIFRIETVDKSLFVKELPKFPEANGLIYSIKQCVLKISRSRQEELATGAAIAICSAMASNRFHIEGRPAVTHQYVMNVARSGQGKGAGFSIAAKLFNPNNALGKYNLIGLRNYSSIASFVNGLPTQRSRLDMVDEFGAVIKGLAAGSDLKKELEGLLCELYTNNGDYWHGHTTKTDGRQGACYAPAVTIYGNIQEETLIANANKSQIDSGLLSRFLYFSADTNADFNPNYLDNIDLEPIIKECERLFPFHSMESVSADGKVILDTGSIEPHREAMSYGAGYIAYRKDVDMALHYEERELESSGDITGAIFLSRRVQLAERLAITNAICCDRREILVSDLAYGIAVVSAAMSRAKSYLGSVGGENLVDKKMQWALRHLEKRAFVKHKDMLRFSKLDAKTFKNIMATLVEAEQVTQFKDAKSGGLCYALA